MATYFDKSFFPYNPQSDIDLYGQAFYKTQPDLPKDVEDICYTSVWQSAADQYGKFRHTRLFLGMLNKFFDRSQDEAQYFKSLSSTEQYSERYRVSQRDGDYFWSSRQTTSNKLGFLDESINPSVYRGDLDEDGKIDGVLLKNAFVKDDIKNPINAAKSEEIWYELRTEGVINSDGFINNFTEDSDLGLSPENTEQKDHVLDILKESSTMKNDSNYVVSQLIWSLVGRPEAAGRHMNQMQRMSIGRLSDQISDLDSVANDMLPDDTRNRLNDSTNFLNLNESDIISRVDKILVKQKGSFKNKELYDLAVLLSVSQHLFLQGRRNLFGWAKQGFNQWHLDDAPASTDRTTTRQRILSTFNPQDQMVFDQQLSGAIHTDPLGAMLHDFSFTSEQSKTEYRQHAVIQEADSIKTIVFQSQQDPSSWVGVSRDVKGFKWEYGTYSDSDSKWSPNNNAVTGLSELDKNSIQRRLIALDPLRKFIQKIMAGAVSYMNTQSGNNSLTDAEWYAQSQSAIKELRNAADNTAADAAYDRWLKAFPVATLYRALELSNGKSGIDFSTYQSVYTNESAGWENSNDGTVAQDVFVKKGEITEAESQAIWAILKDKEVLNERCELNPKLTIDQANINTWLDGKAEAIRSHALSILKQVHDPGILIKDSRRVFVDQGYFYRMDAALASQLTEDKRLFLNKGVAQSRANKAYNERRRDKQAMKAAQWVRDYKSWRDQQDALLS